MSRVLVERELAQDDTAKQLEGKQPIYDSISMKKTLMELGSKARDDEKMIVQLEHLTNQVIENRSLVAPMQATPEVRMPNNVPKDFTLCCSITFNSLTVFLYNFKPLVERAVPVSALSPRSFSLQDTRGVPIFWYKANCANTLSDLALIGFVAKLYKFLQHKKDGYSGWELRG